MVAYTFALICALVVSCIFLCCPKEVHSTCVDVDNDCANYGRDYVCTGDYIPWAQLYCKKYCNFCGQDCVDVDSDCADYGYEYICHGDYLPWSAVHCRRFCNLCTSVLATVNVALYKPATQSTNYVEGVNVWSANTAVDGKTTCVLPPTSQYYSATKSGMSLPSWWRVDLEKVYVVNQIIVHGKPEDKNDQLTGFRLYLTKQRIDNPDLSLAVYNNTDYGKGIFAIKVSTEAQFVMLMMPGPFEALVLCEVEVYGTEVLDTSTTSVATKSTTTEQSTAVATTTQFSTSLPPTPAATATTVINMCPSQVEQRVQSQYLFHYGGKCYEFVPLNDSWMHAREDCHRKGGHMLSIVSPEEQTFIYNILTTHNLTVQELWLGLDDRVNEEQWKWDSGDSVNYINWIPGRYIDQYHDQEDCAAMVTTRGGKWDDIDCNAVVSGGIISNPWICQYATSNSTSATSSAGDWSSWFYGSCSVSCGSGTAHRVRRCSTGHNVDCAGKDFETVSCYAGPCPVDGSWNSWQQWSTCSTTCGDGIHFRTRDCDDPTPQHGGTNCSGSANETTPCHLIDCPPSWSSWFYGTCSETCGPGTRTKLRRCSTGQESDCTGKAFEIVACNDGPCPVDGSWSSWQQWSTCSTTCGDGKRFRLRNCTNPAPQHGGMICSGSNNETSTCNISDCPHWLKFYEASSCSATCGTGFIQLKRNCSSGNPRDCHGSEYSEKPCNLMNCS